MLRKILIALFGFILFIVLGVVYIIAQAQIYFPETGKYPVGRQVFNLVDEARDEVFTEDPRDKRELQLSIYYPIDATDAPLAPYLEPYMVQAVVMYSGMPEIAYSWIHHHSHNTAPAAGQFPVLLFSPGFGNLPQFYASLLEGFASEGYVVIALAHPYSTGVVAFPDGRVLQANELGSAAFVNAEGDKQMREEARIRAVWVEDLRFVLEQIPAINADLGGVMDSARIGLIGHSFGGKALTEALAQDNRFLAGLNLDGGAMNSEISLNQPYLLMMSDVPALSAAEMEALGVTSETLQRNWDARLAAYEGIVGDSGYVLTLLESAHNTFMTDFTLAPSLYRFAITEALVGKIDGQIAYEQILQTSVAFFDAALKGENFVVEANPYLRMEQMPKN